MAPKLPPIKWAQRKDAIYVTIDLPDVKQEKVALSNDKLCFSGVSGENQYEIELKFFKEVDVNATQSKWKVHNRNVQFYILKKEKNEPFWLRLLEDKHLEKTNVGIDWSKFTDEDETEEKFDESSLGGGSGFDFSNMMKDMEKNPIPPPAPMTSEDMEYVESANGGSSSLLKNKKKDDEEDDDDDQDLLEDLDIPPLEGS